MSVIAALFSGISGIVSNGAALSVAGDNIANMSTPAFKSSTAVFESALSQRIGSAEVGLGGRLATTSANFSQGALSGTSRALDLAVQDKGFFVVKASSGEELYTRAGNFELDGDGLVVSSAGGLKLQGYAVDASGNVQTTADNINLQNVNSAPVATTELGLSANLDAGTTIRTLGSVPLNLTSFANAEASTDFNITNTMYDSLGNERQTKTFFRHAGNNAWTYYTLTDGANIGSNYTGASGGTVVLTEGLINFTSAGALASTPVAVLQGDVTYGAYSSTAAAADTAVAAGQRIPPSGVVRWSNGAATLPLADNPASPATGDLVVDFGQVSGSTTSLTQYAVESTVGNVTQNGRQSGTLQSLEVSQDGTIKGSFSNGQTRDLYKIPLAIFANEEGLSRAGNNAFSASSDSGTPQIGVAQAGGRGVIRSFSIEQSNVDIASEFVRIITYQRAFQASARTVSTAAEMLQDLVRLGS